MNKLFPLGGRSAAFLNGACVVMGGRPGKVVKVDTKNFVVDFPDQWLSVDGETVSEASPSPPAESAPEAPSPPPVTIPDLAPVSEPETTDEPADEEHPE